MAHPSSSAAPAAVSPGPADGLVAPSPWAWRPDAPSVAASPVSLLRLQGPDSLRFLHGQTSQAIELARPGQWLSTCCITPTARLRALAEVLVTEDGAWLVIRVGEGAGVRQALDRVLFPADAVELGPLREGWLLEPVPGAGDAADSASCGESTPHTDVAAPSNACWRPLQGGEGFWLGDQLLLLEDAASCPALEPAARELLARPRLEAGERERWRIQLGWPACPAELNDETNPFELGLAARVSLSKGCYVGQETLAKLATYDGVKQQLRRWVCTAQDAGMEPSTNLVPGAVLTSATGERAGWISSVLALPADGGQAAQWIGLALVRRSALEMGSLTVAREGADPLTLQLSLPEQFVAPPVGAGGAGRAVG